ncbi:hypothetical protein EI427_06155 [Flammeovirga pectinis]|uniref:Peptidase C14 caspase domain-containing protein n=1 Tax=Flammeovirga pectinis TaxID=2494373 RepID=A0A3S9P0V9_9BACT|nr:caspase family protein [Flammeovirga pectinis]AZQ61833.1 hypothetical protein EI427_06155 [Flammeovirga pectinis]
MYLKILILKWRLIITIGLFFYAQCSFSQDANIALTFSQGHLGKVTSLDISKDGALIISAGEDRTIKIWDTGQERLLRTINAHEIGVADISLSKDKQFIVSAGLDHSVKVWETKSGKLVSAIDHLSDAIIEVRFKKDIIIYINAQGEVYHWDWLSKEKAKVHNWSAELTSGVSTFISFPKSNNSVIFGKFDGSVEIWNISQKKVKKQKKLFEDWVADIIFLKEQNVIICGGWDGKLISWNIDTDSITDNGYMPDGTGVNTIKYSHSIGKVIITSRGNHAYFYKIEGDSLLLEKEFSSREIITSAFSKKGDVVVVAYNDGEIALWEVKGMKLIASWKPIKDKAKGFSVSLIAQCIAVSSESGALRLWKLGSREDLTKWEAHDQEISNTKFKSNGKLVTTSLDSTIKVWDNTTNFQLSHEYKVNAPIYHSYLLPNDSTLLYSDNAGNLFSINTTQIKSKPKLVYSSYYQITAITSTLSGSKIAIGFSDRKVVVVPVQNTADKIIFRSKDRLITSLSFSNDEKELIVGGKNKLSLWDLTNASLIRSIDVENKILSAKFTYDNKYVIAAEENGRLLTFSNDLSSIIYDYKQSKGNVVDVLDFPGKQVFLTLSNDLGVGIWDLDSDLRFGVVLSDGDIGWVVQHNSGLFDASESNMKNLYYVAGNETIDLVQLQDMYWEPSLGSKLFMGSELRVVPELTDILLYPEARMHKKGDKLLVEVVDRGGGIGKVAVLVNGKEVLSDISEYKINNTLNKINILNQKHDKNKYSVPLDSLSYLFEGGGNLNNITIKVENLEGTLSGRGLTIKHKSKNEDQTIPSFYGIVVGVSDYRGTTLDLKYAAKDAEKIATSIKSSAQELFGEHRVHVDLFSTGSTDPKHQPNKQNIKLAFDSLQQLATPSDVLFVFLAGHGMSVKEKNGDEDFFFLTKDISTADLTDNRIKEAYAIAGKEWLDWMKKIPITRQVFIMDACNAGKFAETIIASRNIDEEAVRLRALERVRTRSGMYLLAGSAADKVSYESSMYGQGLLTYSILDYLKRGNLRKGEFLDVQMMFGNSVDEVPRLAERFGAFQQPEMRIPHGGDSFDIGRVTDDVKSNISISSNLARIRMSDFEEDSIWTDPLQLSAYFDRKLLQLSEGKNSGYNSFTFTPYAKGEGVFQLKGKYTENDNEIQVAIKIIEDNEVKYSFKTEAEDREILIEKAIFEIVTYFKDN